MKVDLNEIGKIFCKGEEVKSLLMKDNIYWTELIKSNINYIPDMSTNNQYGFIVSSSKAMTPYYAEFKAFDKEVGNFRSSWLYNSPSAEYIEIKLDQPKRIWKVGLNASNHAVVSAPSVTEVGGLTGNDYVKFTDINKSISKSKLDYFEIDSMNEYESIRFTIVNTPQNRYNYSGFGEIEIYVYE